MWREAAARIISVSGGRPITVLTVNEPSLMYYLRPRHYEIKPGDPDPYPEKAVKGIVWWTVFEDGGGRNYLDKAIALARTEGRDLFVVATVPDVQDLDAHAAASPPAADATLRATLEEEFAIVDVFQVTVGPKDESIWLYRARAGG
jgi:hypothetical protein